MTENAPENSSEVPGPDSDGPGLFRNANFLFLWIGEGVSLVGDQFYFIALPWLVLRATGDPLAMGTVLAVAGVPRALFILVGGAVTDRVSPRSVMLASNLVRMALVAAMAALVRADAISLWMIYCFAMSFGLADAFFFPAFNTILPRLVDTGVLQRANAIMQATMQLSFLAGPVSAGLIIAAFAGGGADNGPPNLDGIAIAFGVDALTFIASAIGLFLIRLAPRSTENDSSSADHVLKTVMRGLAAVARDSTFRPLFVILASINLFFIGPFMVGIPVLADTRFPGGATAFGTLMSAFGGGALVGALLAGGLPSLPKSALGLTLGVLLLPMGAGLVVLGYVQSTWAAATVTVAMGIANGYVNVLFITWLQQQTPEEMMGRMMSLVMFASLGLVPISMALSGTLIKLNTTYFFVVTGCLLIAVVVYATSNSSLRAMGHRECKALYEEDPIEASPNPS